MTPGHRGRGTPLRSVVVIGRGALKPQVAGARRSNRASLLHWVPGFWTYDTRANEMYRVVVLFLAYTGVRLGEVAALEVRRRAVIAESVTPVQGKGLVWGTPKTH
jgi:integrase